MSAAPEQEQIGEDGQKNEETILRGAKRRKVMREERSLQDRRRRNRVMLGQVMIPMTKDVHKDIMSELEQHIREKDSQKKKEEEEAISKVYMPMLRGSAKKGNEIISDMFSYVKIMAENVNKEIARSKLSAMILNLKSPKEVEVGENENEEDDMTEADLNKILANIKDKHEHFLFRASTLHCRWLWQRHMRSLLDCARNGLALYSDEHNGATFVVEKISRKSFNFYGSHLNFIAKSTADEEMHMFFVQSKGPFGSMEVSACRMLDDDAGVKRGCKFCGREVFHPSGPLPKLTP